MKTICLVLLFAVAAFAIPSHSEFRTLFDCYGKDDGNYPSHGACSTAFVTCKAGHRTHRHCPVDRRYHSVLDKCLDDHHTPGCSAFSSDENLCFGRATGFYPVEGDCSAFIFCAHEITTRLTCAEGLHYNPLHHRCEDPLRFPGECGLRAEGPAFDCHHRAAGKYAHQDNDAIYFTCDYDSSLWIFTCNHGFAFDGEDCAEIGGVLTSLPARKAGAEEFCSAMGDGVFADPDNCASATMCWQGYGFDITCSNPDAPYYSDFIQGCGIVKGDFCATANADHAEGSDGRAKYFYGF